MAQDHYQVLGVSQSASDADIKQSYRRLAMKLHPDSNPDPNAHAQFLRINEAYQTLSDPLLRSQYNRQLQRFKMGDAHAFNKRRVYRQPSPPPVHPNEPPPMSDEERERRYKEAKIRQKEQIYQEFKQYAPYVRVLSFLSLLYLGFFFADWFMGTATEREPVEDMAEYLGPDNRLACDIITPTQTIPFYCNRWDYVRIGDSVRIFRTVMLEKVYRIEVARMPNDSTQSRLRTIDFPPRPSVYNIFSFFWILLLVFAGGGLYFHFKPEHQFRFGLGMLGLIPLNLLMLYLS